MLGTATGTIRAQCKGDGGTVQKVPDAAKDWDAFLLSQMCYFSKSFFAKDTPYTPVASKKSGMVPIQNAPIKGFKIFADEMV